MKKTLSALAILLFISIAAQAQAPNQFNYQGVARNPDGSPLVSTTISLRLSILDGSPTGTIVYQETQSAMTNAFGLFYVAIDGPLAVVSPSYGTFTSVAWGTGSKYMQVEIELSGASSYTMLGTSQLLSVPYALVSGIGGWSDYMLAEEQAASGTGAAEAVPSGGGWITRKLNTPAFSSGTAITFNASANSITLNQPGVYYAKASATAYGTWDHKLTIRDITASTSTAPLINGISHDANGTYYGYSTSEAEGFITVTSPITIILSHYITTAHGGAGSLGDPSSAGIPEVYSRVLVQKIK